MRIKMFSDVHANHHALEAIWSDIEGSHPDKIYCLGDLGGYGAYPDEATQFVRVRGIPTVIGNYDDGVCHEKEDCSGA